MTSLRHFLSRFWTCVLSRDQSCNSMLLHDPSLVLLQWWQTEPSQDASDETASARAILNIQRRQIESTLSSYSTEALRAPLKLPRLVAPESRIDGSLFRTNESKIFVATRINKIRVLSRALLHMSRDSVRTSFHFHSHSFILTLV